MHQELLSAVAVVVTFVVFVPYIRSIRRGETRPHVFSWVIWGMGTFIVFFAMLAGGGGLGAWVVGLSGVVTSYIAWLAYRRRADTRITGGDWGFFAAALSAVPLWFFTSDPLWAVVTLTAVDVIGFGPTVRHAYARPREESAGFFALSAGRNLLVVLALERHSLTTVLFPAAVGLACLVVSLMVAWRRRLPAA